MAAVMTVFGAAAGFANNNNNGYNTSGNKYGHGAAVHGTVMNKPNTPVHNCNCRSCVEMRKRLEMERLHKVTEGAVKGCHCKKCETFRYKMNHKTHVAKPQVRGTSYRH